MLLKVLRETPNWGIKKSFDVAIEAFSLKYSGRESNPHDL